MASYGSNFVQGAGTGAVAGAAAGPWGALAGGVIGGVAGLLSAYEEEQDAKKKQAILERIQSTYNFNNEQISQLINDFYTNPENFLGTKEDVAAYKQALSEYNPEAFVYDFDKFSYDKDVEDFLNPYMDKIIDQTEKSVQHSAAGAGVGRGTGAANAIATAVAQKNDELYKTALQQYNTDKSQSYAEWSGNITAMQNKLNQLKSATDTKISNMGNLAQDYSNTQKQYASDVIAQKQAANNGNLSLAAMQLSI